MSTDTLGHALFGEDAPKFTVDDDTKYKYVHDDDDDEYIHDEHVCFHDDKYNLNFSLKNSEQDIIKYLKLNDKNILEKFNHSCKNMIGKFDWKPNERGVADLKGYFDKIYFVIDLSISQMQSFFKLLFNLQQLTEQHVLWYIQQIYANCKIYYSNICHEILTSTDLYKTVTNLMSNFYKYK